MTDGRVAQGKFICLDRLGNIILEDVIERREITFHNETDEQKSVYKWETERSLSQAVIPGERLARVQIDKDEYQRRVGSLRT
jgi:small nuclear ribonucleoprotein (snRNP)-like protein